MKAPNQDIAVTVDLMKNQKGEWVGAMSMPAQGAQDIPLSDINVQENAVRFGMLRAQGAPAVDAKLSADGSELSGTMSAGGQSIPIQLKRKGDAVIKAAPPSTALAKEFEGSWAGTLDTGMQQLHLLLKLSRSPEGTAAGTLTSVDQGNVEIPITTVTQKDKSIQFEIRAIAGSYTGTLSADGSAISGTWTQAGNSMPLDLKKQK